MSENKELILSNNNDIFTIDTEDSNNKNKVPFGEEKLPYEKPEMKIGVMELYKVLYDKLSSISVPKRIESVMDAVGSDDTKRLEDEYYKEFDCKIEADKIKLEARYLWTKLLIEKQLYQNNPNYERYLKATYDIFRTAIHLKPEENLKPEGLSDIRKKYSELKQILLLMELELRLPIAFVTEAETVYKLVNSNKAVTTPGEGGVTK